jgi:hypothetical protein
MKKLIIILFAMALSHAIAISQGCLPQGITFTTQAQIDNFQTNYPGCTVIEGDVKIYSSEITNLNGLNMITTIGGKLHILNTNLVDFMGLNALEFIGGNFIVIENYSLQSFMGLESLTNIGGSIYLCGLFQLTDISALEGLSELTGNLSIEDVGLTSLYGLHNIITIHGYLRLYECCDVEDFGGLQSLNYIGGNFEINSNTDAINFSGFENLQTIGGDFDLISNNFLTMEGLTGLQTIIGDFVFNFNFNLINLNGLENLTELNGGLGIAFSDNLTNINGIQNISPGSLNAIGIFHNQMLADCDINSICQYLIAPGGIVQIHDNASGCNSPEEVEEHCMTSIENYPTNGDLILFPNPASSFITITTPQGEPVEEVVIYNHLGQKVLTLKPVNNTVDVSKLNPGIYLFEVFTKKNRFLKKLLVE